MKLNKILILAVFLSLVAVTVISQISPDNPTLQETKSCNTIFYDEYEDVYAYITRQRNIEGYCTYYKNATNCLNLTGSNTDCSIEQSTSQFPCITGTESYQSYEKTGTQKVTKNKTECRSAKFIVTVNNQKKEIDFSSWGVCVNSTENGCLAITCGSLEGGSARNGIFNGCDGGKACQKFLFCQDKTKVLYKESSDTFVEQDPTFNLDKLAVKEVTG